MNNAKDRYQQYLQTDYWKEVSRLVKVRAGFRCQLCNSQLDLVAHHRCYDHRGDEMNHLDDLVCICQRCHTAVHCKAPAQAPQPKERLIHGITKAQRRQARREARIAARTFQIADRVPPKPQVEKKEVRMADIEARIPAGDPITLTRENVIDLKTELGGYTFKTVTALGEKWGRMVTGWTIRLVGTQISREKYREALVGSFSTKKYKLIP